MQYIGLYRELAPDQHRTYRESIHEAIAQGASYSVDEVASYLEAGHDLLDIMEGTSDVVGGVFSVPGGPSMMTDGEYAWRYDLSFYVRHYAPALPDAFAARVAENGGVVPSKTFEELREASATVRRDLGFRKSEQFQNRRKGP
ncbi:hypothetical protein [Streptomyces sp. NPDC049881]|uniref:hypothetical protein n=1 Tax=Streptomyces sp. NPDC049881 TaxID=3155778 RepID=UPI00343407D7